MEDLWGRGGIFLAALKMGVEVRRKVLFAKWNDIKAFIAKVFLLFSPIRFGFAILSGECNLHSLKSVLSFDTAPYGLYWQFLIGNKIYLI